MAVGGGVTPGQRTAVGRLLGQRMVVSGAGGALGWGMVVSGGGTVMEDGGLRVGGAGMEDSGLGVVLGWRTVVSGGRGALGRRTAVWHGGTGLSLGSDCRGTECLLIESLGEQGGSSFWDIPSVCFHVTCGCFLAPSQAPGVNWLCLRGSCVFLILEGEGGWSFFASQSRVSTLFGSGRVL